MNGSSGAPTLPIWTGDHHREPGVPWLAHRPCLHGAENLAGIQSNNQEGLRMPNFMRTRSVMLHAAFGRS